MACYHPNLVHRVLDDQTGEVKTLFDGPAIVSDLSILSDQYPDISGYKGYSLVPCGKCLGCRLDYSRNWANRMLLEYDHIPFALFVTLTYNNDNLPLYWRSDLPTFDKRHIQLFFKRLRRYFEPLTIRYYLSAEYGPKTHRPHYHAIIYGLSLSDFPDIVPVSTNDLGQCVYKSDLFTRFWPYGFSSIAEVSYQTFAYVSRYTLKKAGLRSEDDSLFIPEFSMCSLKPGIGGFFLEDHPEIGPDNLNYHVKMPSHVESIPIPGKLIDLALSSDPQKAYEFKSARQKLAEDNLMLQLASSDLGLSEYLENKERSLSSRVSPLKKRLDI